MCQNIVQGTHPLRERRTMLEGRWSLVLNCLAPFPTFLLHFLWDSPGIHETTHRCWFITFHQTNQSTSWALCVPNTNAKRSTCVSCSYIWGWILCKKMKLITTSLKDLWYYPCNYLYGNCILGLVFSPGPRNSGDDPEEYSLISES